MDPLTLITMVLTFIGVLIIGFAKYYERKAASGEVWSDSKFGMFFLVALVVMIFEYFATGGMTFPAEETITPILAILTPIFSLFGATYSTIIGGRLVKNKVVVPVLSSIKESPPASGAGFAMGYTVTPTYKEGKSPVAVTFKIYATQVQPDHPGVVSVDIDWADNTPVQNVPMVNGEATVPHVFAFAATPKYTGHTYFPIFTFIGSDGSKTYFNVDGKGVEIWVQA